MATSSSFYATVSAPRRSRRRYYLILVGLALATLLILYGLRVFTSMPAPVAVTATSGVAQFNFRVTGIPVPGVVPGLQAKVQLDPEHMATTHGTITADLAKLNTGLALRDEHARNYLGVAAHPTATFALSKLEGLDRIAPGEHKAGYAVGTLSVNGAMRPVKAPIEFDFTNVQVLAVSTHFNLAFQDYNIDIPGADPQTDISAKFQLPVPAQP